ncbi:RbsD/FucU family protein [Pseudolysinimonas sp.]|uniref:RbsD/FucU family protein n=1 Tax=Pseudolysinimonas sp. TaxID=2680009 RepID=UPI003F7F72A1
MTLKGIDPLLSGELLKGLDELGHGQLLVVADRNFPAYAPGAPVTRVDADAETAVRAILSVFPLDTFVPTPIERMIPSEEGPEPNPVQDAVLAAASELEGRELEYRDIARMSFYDRAAQARLVVLTRETAPYCDFVLIKGVV